MKHFVPWVEHFVSYTELLDWLYFVRRRFIMTEIVFILLDFPIAIW